MMRFGASVMRLPPKFFSYHALAAFGRRLVQVDVIERQHRLRLRAEADDGHRHQKRREPGGA